MSARRARVRCGWAQASSPLYVEYHDREWGVPSHDDRHLFEMLILEGAQAGLSWETILNRRENYRRAFARFDPERVAAFGAAQRRTLLADSGIIRNRLKIEAAISNARAFLEVQREHGSFDAWLWQFVDGKPVVNRWRFLRDILPQTPLSLALSKELRRRGFRFVGPTIVYAFMQAVGMVNDHVVDCFRHEQVGRRARGGGPSKAAAAER
ncbi:MAG: DNA-3-methyladenine glycosylase I [Candidatus Rokuibacteriota bacterium]|nr:MAG: DNA-3-methyladenine glycosylase I [Candidatus Rokubacteria bacterium]